MEKETYCLCGQPYSVGQFMIECDCCREWFHGSCVDVKIYQSEDIDKYHCPKCSQTYGPCVLKIPTNGHRQDRYEIGAETRAAQAGAPAWVAALAARPLRPAALAVQTLHPDHFTEETVRDNGFTRPVFFNSQEGLGMQMPNAGTFTARSVLRYCGANLEVEVIDVRKQSSLRMPLGDFVDYMETPHELRDEKVLNVLSLEISDTSMAGIISPPALATRLDWAERVWPAAEHRPPRPAVQKYCLMSAAGSYTDFHVDFGGTSVWYHALKGRKIFYLVPPTTTNLALYQQWNTSNNQSERFFGDLVEWYGTVEVASGQTLFIPTGWIHAVLTPEDSLVFGGNFLHSYAIELQLQINEIERRVETPIVFRYPLFESMHWYAGAHLLTVLRRHNEEKQDEDFTIKESGVKPSPPELPPLLVRGVRILTTALKEWHALKNTEASKRDNVPKCLNSAQLVRELCRELRKLEKHKTTVNRDKDYKPKQSSPTKAQDQKMRKLQAQQAAHKKAIKLTLPKPIMHMGSNGEQLQECNRMYIGNKEVIYQDNKTYIDGKEIFYQDGKTYVNSKDVIYHDGKAYAGLEDTKPYLSDGKELSPVGVVSGAGAGYLTSGYEEAYAQPPGDYVERHERKGGGSVLRIKLGSSPSSSREEIPPPAYTLPEHSILKSHLIGRSASVPALKSIQQWTISKKDIIGDCQEEQILFTNENLQMPPEIRSVRPLDAQELNYGPGMYSAEDLPADFHYSETAKPGSYQPDYSNFQNTSIQSDVPIAYTVDNGYSGRGREYQTDVNSYVERKYEVVGPDGQLADDLGAPPGHESASYGTVTAHEPPPHYQQELPSYDAAVASHYAPANYIVQEARPVKRSPKPPAPAPQAVRRSERPVRRRLSNTYSYEDGDLYIDEAPPRRRKQADHSKQSIRTSVSNYRQPQRLPPANGIESLIQASVLAEEPPDNTEDAAVAGMLSIGERLGGSGGAIPSAGQRTFGLAHHTPDYSQQVESTSNKRARKPLPVIEDDDLIDEADLIKEVHRDDEFVYPSLEMSSDDEEEGIGSRRRRTPRHHNDARRDKDESWSPRARLGRLAPRLRGPVRAGVRREAVRKALQAAAALPHHPQQHTTHQPVKRAPPPPPPKPRRPPPPPPATPPSKAAVSRQKKGMKTAKQRLGKILKIHKMIY